ncbi:ABC transporter permease [Streptomyces sp. NPDC002764]|uniref:ABC transporter permease n=1 Tax=Streptomyces sp. NPDC002764 TaxID=3154428 RepID=UPI0033295DD7
MFRTALRNVLAHKARLLMTMLAVLLGVAFVAGTLVFTDTVGNAYQRQFLGDLQGVSVLATGPLDKNAFEPRPFGKDEVRRLQQLRAARAVTGSVSGFAAVAAKDGAPLGEGHATQAGNYFPRHDGKDVRHPLTAGRPPAGPGEVLLDVRTAERGHYRLGDTVRLAVDGPVLHKRLVGLVRSGDGAVDTGGTLVLFDDTTAQKLLLAPGQYDAVTLEAAPGTSENQLAALARQVLPKGSQITTGTQVREQQRADAVKGTRGLRQVLLAFAAIAVFVGAFVIGNTFTMLVAQRAQETALTRAVGATRRQVTCSVVTEASLLGLCAGGAGFLLGIGVAVGLRHLVASTGSTIPDGPLIVAPRTVLVSLLLGVAVTVLAAYLPARRAALVAPVAAMAAIHAPPAARSLRRRNAAGAALVLVGVLGVLYTSAGGDQGRTTVLLPAALLLVGLIVLTPALSGPAITLATPCLRRFGIPGTLAPRNARRNPRRTAATASALMIGLSLVTGLTVVAVSATDTLHQRATDIVKADFWVRSKSGDLAASVNAALSASRAVTASSPLRTGDMRIGTTDQTVTGVDPRTIGRLLTPRFTSGSFAALGDNGGRTLLIDTDTAAMNRWSTGQRVPAVFPDGTRNTLLIGGIYRSDEFLPTTMIPLPALQPHLKESRDDSVLVRTASGDGDGARRALRQALDHNPLIVMRNTDDLAAAAGGEAIAMLLDVLYGLLAMAVVIAVLGVVNTLSMSVFERTREIGMLRAVGLEPHQTRQMIRLESVLISLFGALLGIGAGAFLGWAAGRLAAESIQGYEMTLPWGRIAVALAGAVCVGILAAIWPAHRAARLNILAALKAN